MLKKLHIVLFITLILFIFKGSFYRLCIHYSSVGNRPEIAISNSKLLNKLETISLGKDITAEELITKANQQTSEILHFTNSKSYTNPNKTYNTRLSNCIGYSALFNTILKYLIRSNKLEQKFKATHHIGKLSFFGVDIHQFLDKPFFKDHDFNTLKNLTTGKIIATDPSLYDYFNVTKVSFKKP